MASGDADGMTADAGEVTGDADTETAIVGELAPRGAAARLCTRSRRLFKAEILRS
jgi:hypothetical protein